MHLCFTQSQVKTDPVTARWFSPGLGPGKVDSFQNTEGNLAFVFDHVLTLRVFIGKHMQEVLFLLSAVRK